MLTEFNVLKPDIPRAGWQAEVYEFWRQPRRLQEQRDWAEFFDLWKEQPRPHDPLWRQRIFSTQAVIDSRKNFDPTLVSHWVWDSVGELFWIANAVLIGGGLLTAIGMIRLL